MLNNVDTAREKLYYDMKMKLLVFCADNVIKRKQELSKIRRKENFYK